MKMCKRILPLLLILLLLPVSVAASTIEPDREATLTVCTRYDGTPIVGMQVEAYLVSTVDAYGELTVTEPFNAYREALDIRGKNDSAWQQMAQTLERFVAAGNVLPTQIITSNEKGIAAFGTLEKGLYLLRARAVEQGNFVYAIAPFFVQLPQRGDSGWDYAVEAHTKPSENDRYMDVTVTKIWKDSCVPAHEHPAITVRLWRDGVLWDTQTLPQNGKWTYTWTHLEAKYDWYVTEDPVEGYTQQEPIEEDGYHFTITNSCNKKPPQTDKPGKLPQTGQLWWPVPVLICLGLVCLIVGLVLRRKDNETDDQ